jgi:hypothetical protein
VLAKSAKSTAFSGGWAKRPIEKNGEWRDTRESNAGARFVDRSPDG